MGAWWFPAIMVIVVGQWIKTTFQIEDPVGAAGDTPVSDAAADMAQGLRDGGYDAGVVSVRLPAGEAMHIAAGDDGLELSIYLLEHEGRHYRLECGHRQRHEATWRGIADSLGSLSVEPVGGA